LDENPLNAERGGNSAEIEITVFMALDTEEAREGLADSR
jgi:hypothetical protein